MVSNPDDALDCAFVRYNAGAIEEKVGFGIGTAEIEHPYLLFLATGEEVGRTRR